MKQLFLILILFFYLFFSSKAQEEKYFKLLIVPSNELTKESLKKISYEKLFTDTVRVKKELQKVLLKFHDIGFVSAIVDSIRINGLGISAHISSGKKYQWAKLSLENIDESVLQKLSIASNTFTKKPLSFSKLKKIQDKIIGYYENNGYPFVQIKLDSISFSGESIAATMILEKHNMFSLDSITLKGNAKLNSYYISRFLGLKSNDLYNEKIVSKISSFLKELSFIRETKPFEVEFSDKKYNLFLYLDNKKSNQFNGILGVLPNDKTTGKLLITGDVNLYLINSFGRGESILFDWKKLEATSQELKAKFNYPFIFKLPLGIDIDFNLHKKDTTYLTVNTNAGVQFFLQRGNYLKVFIENKSSSLISTKGLESTTILPAYADISNVLYGIGYNDEHLDYKFNPKKGYSIKLSIGAGNKQIRKNNKVNPVVYDNIELSSNQAEGTSDISFYTPITENTTLKIQNKSGYIYNKNLFDNELFKLGGMNTLRGFNENSFLVSSYSVFTLEYRLIFEQNSCLYTFIDGAYYEKNIISKFASDYPYGFGAGIDFETKAGIFSVSYALGKQLGNPVEIRSAKIHFGYINRF